MGESCLQVIQMLAHHIQRDQLVSVRYFTEEEQRSLLVPIRDGVLVDPSSGLPKSTEHLQMFVALPNGTLVTTPRLHNTFLHHSSLNAGGPVSMAGWMKISQGQIELITNTSGHYQPSLQAFHHYLRFLQAQGVDLSKTTVGFQVAISSSKAETFFYELEAQTFLELVNESIQSSQELLQKIIATPSISLDRRIKAAAHLEVMPVETPPEIFAILQRQFNRNDPEVISELEDLSSALNFPILLRRLGPGNPTQVRRLTELHRNNFIQGAD